MLHFPDAEEFDGFVKRHPDWIWMIGNEPDVDDQDRLSPEEYAAFLGHVAAVVAKNLKSDNRETVARLVFCQISSPTRRDYCEQAYSVLKALFARRHWPEWPEDIKPADVIHAISVHNYLLTYNTCDSGSRCYGSPLEEHHLLDTAAQWARAMDDFAGWARRLDGGAFANKPLWLTEFGALSAFCRGVLEMRPGVDRLGGVGCSGAAARHNAKREEDFVFYGRNEREGLWGAQWAMLTYLVNPAGATTGNRGDWVAAWWFSARIYWLEGDECPMTGWLFGHDVDCTRDLGRLSRTGETYRDTLYCLTTSTRCPETDARPAAPRGS